LDLEPAPTEGAERGTRRWLPLVTICLGTISTRPSVRRSGVVNAYALVMAALVLRSLADLVGHRRAYFGGLAWS
jgi:hypothetical protein